jgi:N-acetyl sugar amidotransferase
MDTTDPDITFDDKGVCSHCHSFENIIESQNYRKKRNEGELERLVRAIKEGGKGKDYECIIGVSGGVDSTYTAYITKKLGLRPLAVHLDNGWDSELSVNNIEKTLKVLEIDLYTHVLDWEEFRELQLAFLRASTPDSEIPTDHAIHAVLYQTAKRVGVQYILGGTNTATEGGGVPAWSQGHADWKYIRSIHQIYATTRLKSFPHLTPIKFLSYAMINKIKWINLLDYVNYQKKDAQKILKDKLCWKDYGGKHYESIYTRFFQGYILPRKFGYNKKRLHLSSMVWSGQISRGQAVEEIGRNDYPLELQEQDREFVIKKLQISPDEFEMIMFSAPKTFWEYPSYKKVLGKYRRLMYWYHALKRT